MSADPRADPKIVIRRIVESDSDALRELRLRALSTDPMSFGSTFKKESESDAAKWTGWAVRGATSPEMAVLVAERTPGTLIGMVGGVWEENVSHVYGMWVEPLYRKLGLGGKLLDAILAWVDQSYPSSEVRLGVVPSSASAVRLYRSRGFVASGKVEPLPHTPAVVWHEMVRPKSGSNPPP
jgi:ribosomal protein S18 acetylase RimI-like enzyme